MAKLTLEQWERKKSMVIHGDVDLKQSLTEEDFDKLADKQGRRFVDYETRLQFLEDNGYEVNRENLTKDLSARETS